MQRGLFAAVAAAVLSIAYAGAARAAAACQERAAVLAKLARDYSETPVAIGMASNGGVLEVLAAKAGGATFTIIVTMPNGMSCMLASGESFEMLPAQKLAKGDPA